MYKICIDLSCGSKIIIQDFRIIFAYYFLF